MLALRRIEMVGHERDDWRAAVTAWAMQSAVGGGENASERFEQLLALMQNRDANDEEITSQQARQMLRGVTRGNVR